MTLKSLLTFFFITYTCLASFSSKTLSSLDYKNRELAELRAEISRNLRLVKSNRPVSITWRKYQLKKGDNFFKIMARTMMNHDTLSSVNRLVSLYDFRQSETWLIPNVRGIAVYGERLKLAGKYKIHPARIVPVPGRSRLLFIPGRRFKVRQRPYFNLAAFIRPVAGIKSSGFGIRRDPFLKKQRFHRGIDIACPAGSTVKASANGRVIFSGYRGGYGKTIIIEHQNGYQTLYGHLQRSRVKKGQVVQQGQAIAFSGSTGKSTGPHLHFEVRRRGRAVRPNFNHRL